MPAIHKLLSNQHPEFVPDEHPEAPVAHVPSLPPGTRNQFLRCPTPPLAPISVDNLQQFDLQGKIPQYRILIGSK